MLTVAMVISIPRAFASSQMDDARLSILHKTCTQASSSGWSSQRRVWLDPTPADSPEVLCGPISVLGLPSHEAGAALMVHCAQEEEERDESGCEEEEGREDEDEDSGSEESLVDSDSDPEEKGAWARTGEMSHWWPVPMVGLSIRSWSLRKSSDGSGGVVLLVCSETACLDRAQTPACDDNENNSNDK